MSVRLWGQCRVSGAKSGVLIEATRYEHTNVDVSRTLQIRLSCLAPAHGCEARVAGPVGQCESVPCRIPCVEVHFPKARGLSSADVVWGKNIEFCAATALCTLAEAGTKAMECHWLITQAQNRFLRLVLVHAHLSAAGAGSSSFLCPSHHVRRWRSDFSDRTIGSSDDLPGRAGRSL